MSLGARAGLVLGTGLHGGVTRGPLAERYDRLAGGAMALDLEAIGRFACIPPAAVAT